VAGCFALAPSNNDVITGVIIIALVFVTFPLYTTNAAPLKI
jgi:hypothetical protein